MRCWHIPIENWKGLGRSLDRELEGFSDEVFAYPDRELDTYLPASLDRELEGFSDEVFAYPDRELEGFGRRFVHTFQVAWIENWKDLAMSFLHIPQNMSSAVVWIENWWGNLFP